MEKELFNPIKKYFEGLGFTVDGEVSGIDMYMEKGDEKVAVELKQTLDFKVFQQAALRQKIVETVYVGTFLPKNANSTAFKDKVYLLKRLGIGLICVSKRSKTVQIFSEPVVSPLDKFQRHNRLKGDRISTEFKKRRTKGNTGGVTREKLITSYREDALLVLDALAELGGTGKCSDVSKISGITRSTTIMSRNYYGWFKHGDKNGVYAVTDAGYNALEEFEETVYRLKKQTPAEENIKKK